jgi:ceramide glucosyltransferase
VTAAYNLWLVWIPLVVGLLGVLATWLADRAVAGVLRRPSTTSALGPPISILRPIKGLDEGLDDNFASLAEQRYARFEILIGAADAADPALEHARAFARRYPQVPIRVLVCSRQTGLNPKVCILEALSAVAAHDHMVISDSNVRVAPDYLAQLAEQALRPGVGLVTNVVVGSGANTLGSQLESTMLSTFVARGTLFASVFLKRACVVGKSMLFRRSDLERLGGWAPVRDVLAEDYMLGNAFQAAGYQVAIAPCVVSCFVPGWTLRRFAARHLRWAQMRRRISLAAYLTEPLLYPAPFLLAAGTGALLLQVPWALALVFAGLITRLCLDLRLLRRLYAEPIPWQRCLWSLPKDVVAFAVWVIGAFRQTIDWRGNLFIIGPGSRLRPYGQRAWPLTKARGEPVAAELA